MKTQRQKMLEILSQSEVEYVALSNYDGNNCIIVQETTVFVFDTSSKEKLIDVCWLPNVKNQFIL